MGDNMESSFKLLGIILGAIILIAGLAVVINSLINPMFGFLQDLSTGFAAILVGVIIIYAARRLG
jgi:uncharacterized membrane protein YjjB (DUF3815 family)